MGFAQTKTVTWGAHEWTLVRAEITEHLGRQALTGSAFIPDSDLQDGVIEFDIATDGTRNYPGISFRAANQFEYESFYVRPHQPNLPDALQYCPVFKGTSSWQLYNGEGFNAAALLPVNEWIHIRLEIKGTQGRVFVGDVTEPQLVIDDLKHGARGGLVGIRSPNNGRAFFSNFEYRANDELVFTPPEVAAPQLGLIKDWEISQTLHIADVDLENYPSDTDLANLEWQTVTAECDSSR